MPQYSTQWIRNEFLHRLEERGQNYNCSFPHYLSLQISPAIRLLSPPLKEIAADRDIVGESKAHRDYVTSFMSE